MTLFLDKEREYLCWCPPGAAELVPDERYRIDVRLLEEVRGNKCMGQWVKLRFVEGGGN